MSEPGRCSATRGGATTSKSSSSSSTRTRTGCYALRRHLQAQRALRLRSGAGYKDHGLIFAKEETDLQRANDGLGQPVRTLVNERFGEVIAAAGVPRIRFHDLRHTTATLLLVSGMAETLVANRLGHSVKMLQETYTHVLDSMQRDVARHWAVILTPQGTGTG